MPHSEESRQIIAKSLNCCRDTMIGRSLRGVRGGSSSVRSDLGGSSALCAICLLRVGSRPAETRRPALRIGFVQSGQPELELGLDGHKNELATLHDQGAKRFSLDLRVNWKNFVSNLDKIRPNRGRASSAMKPLAPWAASWQTGLACLNAGARHEHRIRKRLSSSFDRRFSFHFPRLSRLAAADAEIRWVADRGGVGLLQHAAALCRGQQWP